MLALSLCFTCVFFFSTKIEAGGLKIFISADMEGVAGAVSPSQIEPDGFEYETFREVMTNEVNAAITAAYKAGATEILVVDSHGDGENLLINKLPEQVQIVRGWPRPYDMMTGIDGSFDGVIFIGYHAGTTNPEGVRAHTFSSANLAAVRLNGVDMSEASFNAAIAGHFNVPVIMISGDDAAVAEAREVIGDIEGAVVKWNYGFHSARTLHPEAAAKLIAEKVRAAIKRIKDFKPYRTGNTNTLDITFKNYRPAEALAFLPMVERLDAHSIRYKGKDMDDIASFFDFMVSYRLDMTP